MTEIRCLGFPTGHNSSFDAGPSEGPARTWEVLFNGAGNLTTERGVELGERFDWQELRTVPVLGGAAGFAAVRQAVEAELEAGHRVLSVGGDHAIAYPVLAAHGEHHEALTVVQFDAHPDLYENFEDNPYSHASPFARLLEAGHIGRLVQVGIRTATRHQREQAERFDVQIFEPWRFDDFLDIVLEGPIYVSLDLDVFDPAHAPGVSHHEPGGLTPRQVFDALLGLPQLVGADVVELNPSRDHADMTAALAAKCVKELVAKIV
ncbi:MAG: agmatinase family protein [Acidobacteriota bacterium]